MLQGSLFGPMIRAGIYRHASPLSASVFGRKFHAFPQLPANAGTFSGLIRSSMLGNLGMKLGLVGGLVGVAESSPLPCALSFKSSLHSGEQPGVEAGMNPTSVEQESGNGLPLPEAVRRNPTTPGSDQILNRAKIPRVIKRPPMNSEAGGHLKPVDYLGGLLNSTNETGRPPRNSEPRGNSNYSDYLRGPPFNKAGGNLNSVDYLRGALRRSNGTGQPPLPQPVADAGRMPRPMDELYEGRSYMRGGPWNFEPPQLESNADVVHIKLMRNNSYVTLTDHKGNKKLSVSAGQVAAKGEKPGRYAGEAAAEYMGRVVKQMRIKSVVVKVSGPVFFRRKKDSILAFKDGYTHSRGDANPIVYVEDTTRKPHNGCRLKKQRRI